MDGFGTEKFREELGYTFTPFDAMVTGSGYPRTVGFKEVKWRMLISPRRWWALFIIEFLLHFIKVYAIIAFLLRRDSTIQYKFQHVSLEWHRLS